ncbi:MAG: D-alanyl-lipoteichoic acid biosynthesis protein DltD [Anaerolineae bacterium]|nr:D-alanyl-lipoteichoic acid biosynthesis protein DltD [Anaerolineae bacterium]
MYTSHLRPALTALALLLVALLAGVRYAEQAEIACVHALAPELAHQKHVGRALPRAAFQQPDLLPFYGSSELKWQTRYDSKSLFTTYPTGFMVSVVGANGAASLITQQSLAAVGGAMRGKKVVVSLSPSFFFHPMSAPVVYSGNFSRLHAFEVAFSADLSYGLKQAAARRMLDYPATLDRDPLLAFAVQRLAEDSPLSVALYYAALPLGKLQTAIIRLQDHWTTMTFLRQRSPDDPMKRLPAEMDWDKLYRRAREATIKEAEGNPFGFNARRWMEEIETVAALDKDSLTDDEFLQTMSVSKEWTDLDLLLQTLQELGAQPLILSMPVPEKYYAHIGVSAGAVQVFYSRLRAAVDRYGFAQEDFAEFGADPYFLLDPQFHLSKAGWVHYSRTIDAFYHDQPLPSRDRSVRASTN